MLILLGIVIFFALLDNVILSTAASLAVCNSLFQESKKLKIFHWNSNYYYYICSRKPKGIQDMNEKAQFAMKTLSTMAKEMYDAERKAINVIKDVLRPCNGGECLIGTEDFADDIFYVYAEPKQNVFRRVLSVRLNKDDEIEVQLEGEPIGDMVEGGWTPFDRAFIADIHFLLDEIRNNIEYSDGYQDGD